MKKTLHQLNPALIAKDWPSLNEKLLALFDVIDENFAEQAEITEALDSHLAVSLNTLEQDFKRLNCYVLRQNAAQCELNKQFLLMWHEANTDKTAQSEVDKAMKLSDLESQDLSFAYYPKHDTAPVTTLKDDDGCRVKPAPYPPTFGARLEQARLALELSLADMATRLGITRYYYEKLETGISPILERHLVALADMDIDLNYLLTGRRHVNS